MRHGWLVANGLVLLGIAWMASAGAREQFARPLLPRTATLAALAGRVPSAALDELEQRAAAESSVRSVSDLAAAYLDREQPGLASAVLERAPAEVRAEPEVAQLYARALFHRGRARAAFAVAQAASDACATREVSGSSSAKLGTGCPGWLVATTSRQVAFLSEVVGAGIDDPLANPGAVRAAYERTVREVRLVALR